MKKLVFGNKDEMPALGLGTWKAASGEVYNAVKIAIKEGYRHIDCAPIYGNEKEVGQAISDSISEGIVERKDLWITSKLWNSNHAPNDVLPALKQTLSDLQLDYLDLFLMHWPVALKKGIDFPRTAAEMIPLDEQPISDTWHAMESVKKTGLAKHIGVSNFSVKKLENLLACSEIKPEMNQVESHPYLQQKELLAFCNANDILFTAYSPLGSFDRPADRKAANEPILLEDKVITKIAKAKNASPAQILIAWAINRGTSVIPKSANAGRIAQNLEAGNIILTEQEMMSISKINNEFRYIHGKIWVLEGGTYSLENIWG